MAGHLLVSTVVVAASDSLVSAIPRGPVDLAIESSDGKQIIGHSHYAVIELDGAVEVHGESRLLDGERDVERARLRVGSGDELPIMESFAHSFFNADGSTLLEVQADFRTGAASCLSYRGNVPSMRQAQLIFPADTYAGVSMEIPISDALRRGSTQTTVQAFSCIPGPRIITVEASVVQSKARFDGYPQELVEIQIKPRLGWLGLLAAPFVPRSYAWFDPKANWEYVGGRNSRYYRGPVVQLVRVGRNGSPAQASGAPAAEPAIAAGREPRPANR